MIWSAKDLSAALNVKINQGINGKQIQFNSNSVEEGDLFIALKGNKDGHDYALHAIEHGANAVIISKEIVGIEPSKAIIVKDTLAALQQMAEYKRKKSKAVFIGVTGSSGKTSTKEAIKTVLSHFGNSFASRGNFNNHLGVPLNLASMPDDTKYAIFEMGMNHRGELRQLTKMVQPDIAVITTISEAHLEFFDSMLDLTDTKCEIFEGMSNEGIAIINLDSKYYGRILSNLEKLSINKIYSFGKSQGADARLELYEKIDDDIHLRYSVKNEKIDIKIPFIPEHYTRNFTAVLMAASCLGLNVNIAAQQLANISLTEGRGKIINVQKDDKKYQLLCDYYNANPESLKASLEYFKQLTTNKKKIAIIGDMLELGESSKQLHENLVPSIIDSGALKVFLVGDHTKHIYNLLPSSIETKHFDNVDILIENLNRLLEGGELILIKGSRGVGLIKVAQYLNR